MYKTGTFNSTKKQFYQKLIIQNLKKIINEMKGF